MGNYPKTFVDSKGMVWHRSDHLSMLERRNSLFRFRGKVMYNRLRKDPYRSYVGRKEGLWERLREIFMLG